MKSEEKKFFTPVPWDNMPREPDANHRRPPATGKYSLSRKSMDPTFSNAHAFYPFQETLSSPEEEK
jgi:hypothetical protein